MSWHARNRVGKKDSGKFRHHAHLGTQKSVGGQYREWHYSFVTHQTGSGVRRTRYAVTICDPKGHRAEYLRDFSSIQQATVAAQQWIDQKLSFDPLDLRPGLVGTIPSLPQSTVDQEK